jgi:hypothetical protein
LLIDKKYVNIALNFINPLLYFSHFFKDISSFETNSNNIRFLNLNSKKLFVLKFKTFLFFWNLLLSTRFTLALRLKNCFRGCSHFLTKVKLSLNFNQPSLNFQTTSTPTLRVVFFSLPLIHECFYFKIEIL